LFVTNANEKELYYWFHGAYYPLNIKEIRIGSIILTKGDQKHTDIPLPKEKDFTCFSGKNIFID